MSTPIEHQRKIEQYYFESQQAYLNWGRDLEREGVYGVHLGLDESPDHKDHYDAVNRLTRTIVDLAMIQNGDTILDAGCGTGSVSFEISSQYPQTRVVGVNISMDQLRSAQRYKLGANVPNVYLTAQDYLATGFPQGTFNRVLFCESMTHASDKKRLLEEAKRITKPDGKVVIFDAFQTEEDNLTEKDRQQLEHLSDGWAIPTVPKLSEVIDWAKQIGFSSITHHDYSSRVFNSAKLMGDHAEQRIQEGKQSTEVLHNSRLACIATRDLMERQIMTYMGLVIE